MSVLYQGLWTTVEVTDLRISRNVGNANVAIDYTVAWSDTDRITNQPYEQTFSLIGVDDASEDGANDPIPLGVFVPYTVIKPNGKATENRTIEFTMVWQNLDEDVNPAQDPDEIQARVKLMPILPKAVSGKSAVIEKVV